MYDDKENESDVRKDLEEKYGKDNVWNTEQATEHFIFESFLAPFAKVIRRSDRAVGTVQFIHAPRFYYDFRPWD